MKHPTLDQADRRVLGIGIIILIAWVLACVAIGAGLGAGVLAFRLMAGLGG